MHESHNLLWSETVACRALQTKHHEVIGNAISFLARVYQDNNEEKNKKIKLDGIFVLSVKWMY